MRYLIVLLFSTVGFWACQPEEACISSATSRVLLGFYVDSIYVDTLATGGINRIDSLLWDTIRFVRVTSTTADSTFWENDSANSLRTTRLLLALDPDKDETTFLFEQPDTPTDTLTLRYQRRYRLISTDCPLEVSFRELQVVHNTFDTAVVVNTELIEPSNDTDVQIIRPRQE